MNQLTIVGLTRFSICSPATLQTFSQTRPMAIAEAQDTIFSPQRMAARFRLFKAFALPTVEMFARQYSSFHHAIFYSDSLPLRWKARLKLMASQRPWMHLVRLKDQDKDAGVRFPLRDAARSFCVSLAKGSRFFTFRLDDDDALSNAYFSIVLERAAAKRASFALSFANGFTIGAMDDALLISPRRYTTPPAAGLGYFDYEQTIFDLGNHRKIASRVPLDHVEADPVMLITYHSYNDSDRKMKSETLAYSTKDASNVLGPSFQHISPRRALASLS